jgi:hypothetical protein
MPYAAAKQQPSTASFGMRLLLQAPEIGASSAFPKGKQNREKNWTLITRHYCEYKSGLKTMKRV